MSSRSSFRHDHSRNRSPEPRSRHRSPKRSHQRDFSRSRSPLQRRSRSPPRRSEKRRELSRSPRKLVKPEPLIEQLVRIKREPDSSSHHAPSPAAMKLETDRVAIASLIADVRPEPTETSRSRGNPSLGLPEPKPVVVVAKPNFGLSGRLYAEKMTVNGVVLKYAEPADACKPTKRWRIYVFKESGDDVKDTLYIHRQSKYLFGRDKRKQIADIPIEHLSCSSQHAVVQFRRKEIIDELSDQPSKFVVKCYIMDINSTNGTFRNNEKLEPAKYYEVLPQDVIKFGESTRQYVFLHDEIPAETEDI